MPFHHFPSSAFGDTAPEVSLSPGEELQYICRLLEAPDLRHIGKVKALLDSPRGSEIASFINEEYGRQFLIQRKTSLIFAAAQLRIELARKEGADPIGRGFSLFLDDSRLLPPLGIAMIGLLLGNWASLEILGAVDSHPAYSKLLKSLCLALKDPGNDLFIPAAFTAARLIMNRLVPADTFPAPSIFEFSPTLPPIVMEYISLLSITGKAACPVIHPEEYLLRFERSIREGEDVPPECCFGALVQLGGYRTEQELSYGWLRLSQYYARHRSKLHRENKIRLALQLYSMPRRLSLPDFSTTGLSYAEFAPPLTGEERGRLSALAAALSRPDGKTIVAGSCRMVLRILKYLQQYGCSDPNAPFLLEKMDFQAPAAGSALITGWFWLLCHYGFSQKALAFFRRFPEILLRPAEADTYRLYDQTDTIHRWLHYASGLTRGTIGILLSIANGHINVLDAFLGSAYPQVTEDIPFLLHPAGISGSVVKQVYSRFDILLNADQYFRIRDLEKIDLPTDLFSPSWQRYYDDRTWIQYILSTDRRSHTQILVNTGKDADFLTAALFALH